MGNSVPVVGDCVCYEGAENRSPEQLKRNRRRTLALLRRTGFRHSEEVSMARERLKARARERREKREALHAQLAKATGVGSGSEEPSKFREQFIREAQEMRHTNYLLACDGYNMRVQIKALEDARAAEKVAAKAEKEFTLSLEISTLTVRDYVEGQTRLSLEFELSCGGTCIIDADWMRDAQKDSVTHGSNERFTILQLREPRLLVWTLPESVMVEWDGVLHVRLAVDSEPQLACWLFVLSDLDEVPTYVPLWPQASMYSRRRRAVSHALFSSVPEIIAKACSDGCGLLSEDDLLTLGLEPGSLAMGPVPMFWKWDTLKIDSSARDAVPAADGALDSGALPFGQAYDINLNAGFGISLNHADNLHEEFHGETMSLKYEEAIDDLDHAYVPKVEQHLALLMQTFFQYVRRTRKSKGMGKDKKKGGVGPTGRPYWEDMRDLAKRDTSMIDAMQFIVEEKQWRTGDIEALREAYIHIGAAAGADPGRGRRPRGPHQGVLVRVAFCDLLLARVHTAVMMWEPNAHLEANPEYGANPPKYQGCTVKAHFAKALICLRRAMRLAERLSGKWSENAEDGSAGSSEDWIAGNDLHPLHLDDPRMCIGREMLILKMQIATCTQDLYEAARNARLFYFPPNTKNKVLRAFDKTTEDTSYEDGEELVRRALADVQLVEKRVTSENAEMQAEAWLTACAHAISEEEERVRPSLKPETIAMLEGGEIDRETLVSKARAATMKRFGKRDWPPPPVEAYMQIQKQLIDERAVNELQWLREDLTADLKWFRSKKEARSAK